MPIKPVSFEEAIDAAKFEKGRVRLLLGNGFSRALRDDLFSYDALYEEVDFSKVSPTAKAAFDALKTRDFESEE